MARTPFTSGNLNGTLIGSDDAYVGNDNSYNVIAGDAGGNILNHATGGNDTFADGANATNIFFGDANGDIDNYGVGGADTFVSSQDTSINNFYGDMP
jgi:hypothetical protein